MAQVRRWQAGRALQLWQAGPALLQNGNVVRCGHMSRDLHNKLRDDDGGTARMLANDDE